MKVAGYIGSISVKEAMDLASNGVYVVNAMCVGSKEHLLYSFMKAKNNFSTSQNIARNFHMELMLILSGRRQIKEALKLCGVENGDKIAIISEGEFSISLKRDDSILNCTPDKLSFLGIESIVKGKECESFFENSAMLELEK